MAVIEINVWKGGKEFLDHFAHKEVLASLPSIFFDRGRLGQKAKH